MFFEECLFIPSQEDERGRTEFVMYDHQRQDLDVLLQNRFVVVLKGRQIGLSTLVGALALWRCLFRPGSVILWMSNNQENANKAVHALNVMWNFLPAWVRDRAPRLSADQKGMKEWEFEDGMTSRVRAYAGTATAGASETASIVVLDEFALVDPHIQDHLLTTTDPTTDAGGSLWIISTARGGHNRFAQTFLNARKGESMYVPVFHPWMVSHFINPLANQMPGCPACSGRGLRIIEAEDGRRRQVTCAECVDTQVYERKAREFADKPWLIHAEYPATIEEAFRESGNPVFKDLPLEEDTDDRWVRGFMRENTEGNPEFVEEPTTGPLRIHEDLLRDGGPDSWRKYVAFVDPAEGVGGDYTAAHVLTWDDDALPQIVAWWHSNDVEPISAARDLGLLGRYFYNALLVVETTGGFGGSMLSELNVHLYYPNLYVHTPSDARRRKRATKLGFDMSWQKRPMVVDRLIEFMQAEKQITGIHPLLRQELGTFVRNEKGRMEADVGCHDDLVMSLAGALWVLVEETEATSRPTSEEARPEIRAGLKATFERIDREREKAQKTEDRWNRRMNRRAESRRRHSERRNRRQRASV